MNINQTQSSPQAATSTENQAVRQLVPDFTQFARQLNLAHQELDWFTADDGRAEKKREAMAQTEKHRHQKDQNDALGNGAAIAAFQVRHQHQRAEVENAGLKAILMDRKHQALDRQHVVHNDIIHEKQVVHNDIIHEKVTAQNIVHEKVTAQKAHLRLPVADSETGNGAKVDFAEAIGAAREETGKPKIATGTGPNDAAIERADASAQRKAGPQAFFTAAAAGAQMKNGEPPAKGISSTPPDQKVAAGRIDPSTGPTGTVKIEAAGTARPATAKADTASNNGSASLSGSGEKAAALKATAETAKPDRTTSHLREVEQNVRYLLSSRKNELVMQLNPEHLGKLVIRLKKEGNRLTGHFRVDSIQAKEALEPQMAQLQRNLAEKGIHVESFRIHANGEDSTASGQGSSFNDNEPSQHWESSTPTTGHQSHPNEHRFQESSEQTAPRQLSADSGINLYA